MKSASEWTSQSKILACSGPSGASGASGPTGPTGTTGPSGVTGPTGVQGITGPSGPSGTSGTVLPSGLLMMTAAPGGAPAGWLLCDGTAVSRTTYSSLFSIIGTTYGVGDNSTTFNLPDLRGRVPIGSGQGSGLTNRTLGGTGGSETHTLTVDEIPAHTHEYSQSIGTSTAASGSSYTVRDVYQTSTTTSTGGGQAHNNMQPYLVINYIIKT